MTRKISILHVVFSLEPGGMENGLVNVANLLPADEFQVNVCCLERRGAFADRLPSSSGVHVLHKKPGKSITTIWALARLIRKLRPNVIHTHDLGPLIYGSWATFGGSRVSILHGEHCQLSPAELLPRRLRQRRSHYRSCRRIHTVAHSLTAQLLQLGLGRSDLASIPNGVDTDRFSPGDKTSARERLGLPTDRPVVGVVGRFVRHKRHREVLDAVRQLAEEGHNVTLLMPGDGPELSAIQADVNDENLGGRVFLPGHMDRPEQAYQAMDCLLIPSLLEGLSNAALEAMACGIPCISHTSCGSTDLICDGKTGWVRDLSDQSALANVLRMAIQAPDDLTEMGEQARMLLTQSFSMDTMVQGYANLYREIAGGQ